MIVISLAAGREKDESSVRPGYIVLHHCFILPLWSCTV